MCNDNSVNYVSECLLSYTDWSGLPFPSLGDLPDPGIELRSPALQADSIPFEPSGKSNIQKNPMDRGAWQATVRRVSKSRT